MNVTIIFEKKEATRRGTEEQRIPKLGIEQKLALLQCQLQAVCCAFFWMVVVIKT